RAHKFENLRLLNESEILQLRLGILFDVGENYFARVADEKAIRKIDNPFPIDFRQQVVVICFWKKIRLPEGMGPVVRSATIFCQPVSPPAMISAAPGCFLPVVSK